MIAEVIATGDVDAIWQHFSFDVAKCLKKTPNPDYSSGDYWTMCRTGMAFLIAVHDGTDFVALTIWRFEGEKFCCLLMVGHGADRWMKSLVERASQTARNGGATALIASGRVGFGKVFKRLLPKARVIRQTYEVTI